MGLELLSVGTAFGSKLLSNAELAESFPDWSPDKIYSKLKIRNRWICDDKETALDMAEKACIKAIANARIANFEIDYMIFCTQSPDFALPPNATQLQHRLGLSKNIGCFDFTHGCSGYVYGLSLAAALISSGQAKVVLLVTADTYSKYIAKTDRISRPIFGDAASATLLRATDKPTGPRSFVFATDGSGAQALIRPVSGAKASQVWAEGLYAETVADGLRTRSDIYMNGPAIFSYTLEVVPNLLHEVLAKDTVSLSEIDAFIFHQANGFMLEQLRVKCKIPAERFIIELENVGNTVSSSIPIALEAALGDSRIVAGNVIFLAGFGVGLSSCACMLKL